MPDNSDVKIKENMMEDYTEERLLESLNEEFEDDIEYDDGEEM